jgi:hypothetical protein
MKRIFLPLFIMSLCFTNLSGSDFVTYKVGKIHLKAGYIIQGDNLSLQDSSVSIMIDGSLKNYKINEINSIYAGKKAGMFNTMGAVVGCATIMIPLLIIGGDFTDYFGTTLTLSAMGGGVIGFATPLLLRSVGRDGIKWSLIYSV